MLVGFEIKATATTKLVKDLKNESTQALRALRNWCGLTSHFFAAVLYKLWLVTTALWLFVYFAFKHFQAQTKEAIGLQAYLKKKIPLILSVLTI